MHAREYVQAYFSFFVPFLLFPFNEDLFFLPYVFLMYTIHHTHPTFLVFEIKFELTLKYVYVCKRVCSSILLFTLFNLLKLRAFFCFITNLYSIVGLDSMHFLDLLLLLSWLCMTSLWSSLLFLLILLQITGLGDNGI